MGVVYNDAHELMEAIDSKPGGDCALRNISVEQWRSVKVLESQFEDLVRERMKKWEELRKEFGAKFMSESSNEKVHYSSNA